MERGSRTRLVTAVVLVFVFGAGVLLGLAADSSLGAQPPETVVSVEGDGAPEEDAPTQGRPIYEQVEPNEVQLAAISTILTEHRARTNALDEEMRAQSNAGFRVIIRETREAIKSVFTAEQAARYQELLDEWDAERAAERAARRAAKEDDGDSRK